MPQLDGATFANGLAPHAEEDDGKKSGEQEGPEKCWQAACHIGVFGWLEVGIQDLVSSGIYAGLGASSRVIMQRNYVQGETRQ